eukprot:2640837-Amphidinium_carterae.2
MPTVTGNFRGRPPPCSRSSPFSANQSRGRPTKGSGKPACTCCLLTANKRNFTVPAALLSDPPK